MKKMENEKLMVTNEMMKKNEIVMKNEMKMKVLKKSERDLVFPSHGLLIPKKRCLVLSSPWRMMQRNFII